MIVTRGAVLSAGLGQVGALHPLLGEVERVEVAGREGGDGLGADHHPGVLDDLEHLRDAVVHLAEQPADGRLAAADTRVAEGELAGVGDLDAHLVLDVGDVDAVALAASSPVSRSKWHLGTMNRLRPLVPGPPAPSTPSGRASTMWMMLSHRSHSAEVMKRLTPSMFQVPSSLGVALVRPAPDVGAGVGLGEDHRGHPAVVDDVLGDLLVPLVAVAVDDAGERRAGAVHPDGGVGAEHHLADGPAEATREPGCRRARRGWPGASTRRPSRPGSSS